MVRFDTERAPAWRCWMALAPIVLVVDRILEIQMTGRAGGGASELPKGARDVGQHHGQRVATQRERTPQWRWLVGAHDGFAIETHANV